MLGSRWLPAKGMPSRKRWKDSESGLLVPWTLQAVDPFLGTAAAGQVTLNLFEFSGDFFKDLLANLRAGRGGHRWTVPAAMATEEYWRQLDAEIKTPAFSRVTGKTHHQWLPRSKHWPNHLLDCETLQVAAPLAQRDELGEERGAPEPEVLLRRPAGQRPPERREALHQRGGDARREGGPPWVSPPSPGGPPRGGL